MKQLAHLLSQLSVGDTWRRDEFGSLDVDQPTSDSRSWARHRWHAADVIPYPSRRRYFERELGRVIREFAIVGHVPPNHLLDAADSIVTLGSCFARELRKCLSDAGLGASGLWIPAGLNNTHAILDFVSWCVTGQETGRGFRYDRYESGEIREWKPESERAAYADAFAEAGAFVFTLGLAEVWQDRLTGGVFWRGVPEEIFDADRHVFRLTTVDENAENIERVLSLVRQVNPDAPIVLTLSPVPLKATFRGISCISADCVSKSVLRVALDQVMAERPRGVYYWPSFEIVKWAGAQTSWPAYGLDDGKARHVTRYVTSEIIDAFVESFYAPAAVQAMRARRPTHVRPVRYRKPLSKRIRKFARKRVRVVRHRLAFIAGQVTPRA